MLYLKNPIKYPTHLPSGKHVPYNNMFCQLLWWYLHTNRLFHWQFLLFWCMSRLDLWNEICGIQLPH